MFLFRRAPTKVTVVNDREWTVKYSGLKPSASTILSNGTKVELRTMRNLRRFFLAEVSLCDFEVGSVVFKNMRSSGEVLQTEDLVSLYRDAVEAINQAREEISEQMLRETSDKAALQIDETKGH